MGDQAPVKEGEMHDVLIKAVGEKGDGIARVGGFVLFVSGVKKGAYVKIKITKVLEKVGFATLVEKLEQPKRESKFATISQEEMNEPEEEIDDLYEDTEDFGEELVEE
jgi:predicted RNA-binding protein with TRAM domain